MYERSFRTARIAQSCLDKTMHLKKIRINHLRGRSHLLLLQITCKVLIRFGERLSLFDNLYGFSPASKTEQKSQLFVVDSARQNGDWVNFLGFGADVEETFKI